MIENEVVQHVAAMEPILAARLQRLVDNHPSVKQARCVGLFGGFDIQKNQRGDFIGKVAEPLSPAMLEFKAALLDKGLFTMVRGHMVHTNPPLIITEEQLHEGFDIIEECLPILDRAMED